MLPSDTQNSIRALLEDSIDPTVIGKRVGVHRNTVNRYANKWMHTVGQKIAARNPFFSIFVAYILPQWYKLPLFLHSRFPTCLEKSERV